MIFTLLNMSRVMKSPPHEKCITDASAAVVVLELFSLIASSFLKWVREPTNFHSVDAS